MTVNLFIRGNIQLSLLTATSMNTGKVVPKSCAENVLPVFERTSSEPYPVIQSGRKGPVLDWVGTA